MTVWYGIYNFLLSKFTHLSWSPNFKNSLEFVSYFNFTHRTVSLLISCLVQDHVTSNCLWVLFRLRPFHKNISIMSVMHWYGFHFCRFTGKNRCQSCENSVQRNSCLFYLLYLLLNISGKVLAPECEALVQ